MYIIYFTLFADDISDILHALEKIVSFYTSSAGESNLDGLYGLKVVEGNVCTVNVVAPESAIMLCNSSFCFIELI